MMNDHQLCGMFAIAQSRLQLLRRHESDQFTERTTVFNILRCILIVVSE